MPRRPYEPLVTALQDRVLRGPGKVDSRLRQAAYDGAVPDDLAGYVDKVRHRAYQVSDADLADLRRVHSDDELFEITVAAALGAGLSRLEATLAALEQA